MKKVVKIYMVAALIAAFSPAVYAQTTASAPVKVVCNELKQQGKDLLIDAVITIDGSQISKCENLTLTPVLESSSQKEGLPSILVNGKVAQKVYDRKIALNNLQDEPRYQVVKATKGESVVNYKKTIPFESWMKDAKFVLVPNMCDCGKNYAGGPLLIADRVMTRPDKAYEVAPTFAYITPQAEAEKHRAEVGTAYLDFQVGKSVILPDFRNNATELAKIDNTVNTLVNDKNVSAKGLMLKGYASPEGSYKLNSSLADKRVKALSAYIQKKHNFKKDFFTLETEPENWAGFKSKVEADNQVPDKDAVLDIINSSADPDAKEAKLKVLNGGTAYKYVLAGMFPSLRRSEYRVDYTVREFSAEEGRNIIKSHPEQLSLSEMFAVANTYQVGSEDYNNVFETAVKMFPNDPVANLNAANIALQNKDLDSASKYLSKAGNSSEAIHARGVLNLMEGNLSEAKTLLEQAKNAGVKEASANLEELSKKEADNALFDSFK